jgi:AraC-like DNA-binding protein
MGELAERVTHLDDLFGADAALLRERLLDARSPVARFERLESWLRRRIGTGPHSDHAVLWAADAITRHAGDLRVDTVARALGVSRKELGRRFRDTVGLTPKTFARVRRFVALLARLDRGVMTTLSDVAHDAGYHDHSHFTRDFRAFTGVAPSEYLERRTPYTGGIVGD